MAEHHLVIDAVKKSFGANQVVRGADIAVGRGEFVSFLGPSGCGKTTILRMVAGFETPTSGRILIDGKDVTDLKPSARNIGMVFQAYALFPNLTVAGNIGFGLKVAGMGATDVAARVAEMLALIKLPQLADRYPWQLSGGQQQRVALARALAPRPSVLLLDEPLSALDAKIRVSLREEIRAIQKTLGITTIFVTHDQEEALTMSDRVMVMNEGRIDQIGTPFDIYNKPATRFVANFVGTLSTLAATVADARKGTLAITGAMAAPATGKAKPEAASPVVTLSGLTLPDGLAKDDAVTLALRPESLRLGPAIRKGDATLTGTVAAVGFMGSVIRVDVRVGEKAELSLDAFNDPATPPPAIGETVTLGFDPRAALVLGT
jgi:putative spermidine/putrescine transport system ATP-binding protein